MKRPQASEPKDSENRPDPSDVPAWITPELVEQTLKIWQPYYSYRLTPDDALAIIKVVGDLFEVLSRGSDS